MIWEEGILGIYEGFRRVLFKTINSKIFDKFIVYVVILIFHFTKFYIPIFNIISKNYYIK